MARSMSRVQQKAMFAKQGNKNIKPFKSSNLDFHLPLRTSITVPSTTNKDKPISKVEHLKRVKQVERWYINRFGGHTSVRASGGFVSDYRGRIQEPVVVVEGFSTVKNFVGSRKRLRDYVMLKGKQWGQESMAFGFEDDLWFVNTDKKDKK